MSSTDEGYDFYAGFWFGEAENLDVDNIDAIEIDSSQNEIDIDGIYGSDRKLVFSSFTVGLLHKCLIRFKFIVVIIVSY